MPHKLKILVVEDTESDIETYKDTFRTITMDDPEIEINATYATSKESGMQMLLAKKDELHGAFIDLKLQAGAPVDVNEGNDLIAEIYGKLRFPVIVLTNTPGAFNQTFRKSLFLQLKIKAETNYKDVIMSLIAINKTGITNILGKRGRIEKMLDEIFWQNISVTLSEWINEEGREKELLRYTLTHLQEHLEISDDGSQFDTVHPIENYIIPSIKRYFFTGDIIFKKDSPGERFVIMNPACDLAPHDNTMKPKASHIILCSLQDFKDTPIVSAIKAAKKAIKEDDPAKIENKKNALSKIIQNNSSANYYFLPNTTVVNGGLINFQRISSIKASELEGYVKEATITSQFVKDIIAKFSFYYSRQGSPDFDFENILSECLK